MQRELMLTGIGGQGVQLAAKTLAMAAVAEERHAMLLGSFAGAMRGGQTDASVVVGDTPLRALPKLPSAWSALIMHPDYWSDTRDRIRHGGVIVVNSNLMPDTVGRDDCQIFPIPAGTLAIEAGAPLGAAYVALAAYATITGVVSLDALIAAMRELVPPYRTQHLIGNEAALRAGAAAAPALAAPAWTTNQTATAGVAT